MHLKPGTVFAADYEVVRELSSGGMGTLYVVRQKSTGKQRALKLMLPQMVTDPELRRRFEQEARIGSLIESDHVVEVVGAGIDEASGAPWLAMELLKGEELTARAVLDAPGSMTAMHAIMRQLCHALGAAHRAGIVHRDLKPANVFLAESRRAGETRTVKVLDFGIAKIAADAGTQHTIAVGSPTWMAPEQTEKGTVTPAADVWSLALVAYYLLTDKFFWKASQDPNGTVHQVMKEVLFDPIPLASQRAAEQGAPKLPPWFDAWFSHCVVRQASLRYRDANAAFAAFESAIGGGHISLLPPAVSPMTTPMAPPAARPSAPLVRTTPTGPPAPMPPVGPGQTQMGAGMTHVAVSPSEPSKLRWLVPVFGLVATTAVIYFAWAYRYGRPHIDAARPITDAPSATADLPLDDEEDIDPAPPLASGSSSVPRPSKRKKPPPSTSAGPSLSAALAEIGSATPPPQPKSSFDRPGAVIALHAVDIQKCATPDGPKGPSRLTVFYGNDGLPKQFFFDRRGPYPGTAAEMCISALLRSAHVDPFTGPMQAVVIQINLR
jgi:serine/threonine protein kinase